MRALLLGLDSGGGGAPDATAYGDEGADTLGTRSTFADVAATPAEYFGLQAWPTGDSFLPHH
ncbi:MAG: hypothetical protein ABI318_18065 [Chthoniobacteraceae bacterium]